MIYLTGHSGPAVRRIAPWARGLGLMVQPGSYGPAQIALFPYYAADNGCFNPATYVGVERWLEWVGRLPREGCLFVVVPDVARRPDGSLGGDPVATWDRFCELAPKVAAMGFRAALAAQNGIEDMANLAEQLAAADAVFVAGDTAWKETTGLEVAATARRLGKWTHMGRVNTATRYRLACAGLVDSADGNFLAFGPDVNVPRLSSWLTHGAQLALEL